MLSPKSLQFFWAPHSLGDLRVWSLASSQLPPFILCLAAVPVSSLGPDRRVGYSLSSISHPKFMKGSGLQQARLRTPRECLPRSSQRNPENLIPLLCLQQPEVKPPDFLLGLLSLFLIYSLSSQFPSCLCRMILWSFCCFFPTHTEPLLPLLRCLSDIVLIKDNSLPKKNSCASFQHISSFLDYIPMHCVCVFMCQVTKNSILFILLYVIISSQLNLL